MKSFTSDGEIIGALIAKAKYGTLRKAASSVGVHHTTMLHHIAMGKERGLTANSVIKDPIDKAKAEITALKQQVKNLEREAESAEAIRREIYKIAEYSPEPPTWLVKPGTAGSRGMPTFFGSDWHYGEVVNADEVGGTNEFNSTIAGQRIKRGVDTTCDLAFNHMGRSKIEYPGIVFALGGDLISGDIHEELMVTNDRTPQQCVNDLTDIIAAAIETFLGKFGRVFVPCVTGNHGRATHKPRLKGRVFTSYEWNIYCNLVRYFRNEKRVAIQVSNGADTRWNVYGHRYLMTHGDNLGVKGGDGIIGALGPIRRGEIKLRNSEGQIGRDFDTVIMGHWHQYLPLPGLIVNNSIKGLDEYAHLRLRAPWSRPSQALWFTHPEHGITAQWQVYCGENLRNAPKRKAKVLEWGDV